MSLCIRAHIIYETMFVLLIFDCIPILLFWQTNQYEYESMDVPDAVLCNPDSCTNGTFLSSFHLNINKLYNLFRGRMPIIANHKVHLKILHTKGKGSFTVVT